MPLSKRTVVYVDTETTGLDPFVHELLEICCIRDLQPGEAPFVDGLPASAAPEPVPGLAIWWRRVQPQHIETAHPKALEVNGYSQTAWIEATPMSDHLDSLSGFVRDAVLCGQNIKFDTGFLDAAYDNAGIERPYSYHAVDSVTLIYEHLVPCGLESLSLDGACRVLGVSNAGAHSSFADTLRVKAVIEKLSRATFLHWVWWRCRIWWQRLRKK